MRPLTFVQLENQTKFLCSFDLTNWWITDPLPGAIAEIIDYAWVYGEYHICACRKTNGTYSIFQTYHEINDPDGILWREVLNTAERIYCVFVPDLGQAFISTSGGWWRSNNSGTSWTKVTASAPRCFCAKELTNNIYIAISSTNVYKSTDGGSHWVSVKTFSTTLSYPALDGTHNDLLLGVGKQLYYSDDAGDTWIDITAGMKDGWPDPSTYTAITDIELTTVSGYYKGTGTGTSNLPTFIIQILLPSGYYRHYYSIRTPANETDNIPLSEYMFKHTAKFDGYSNIKNSLTADEYNVSGTATNAATVLFSGIDASNRKPLFKKSPDGGLTWTTINVTTLNVFTGPDCLVGTTNPFTEDIYFSASWSHNAICHNYWKVYDEYAIKHQSYDVDAYIQEYVDESVSYSADGWIQGWDAASYKIAGRIIEIPTLDYDADGIIAIDRSVNYQIDALAEMRKVATYGAGSYIQGIDTRSYAMSGLLVSDEFPPFEIIQGVNIRKPANVDAGCEYPFDSRNL